MIEWKSIDCCWLRTQQFWVSIRKLKIGYEKKNEICILWIIEIEIKTQKVCVPQKKDKIEKRRIKMQRKNLENIEIKNNLKVKETNTKNKWSIKKSERAWKRQNKNLQIQIHILTVAKGRINEYDYGNGRRQKWNTSNRAQPMISCNICNSG